MTIVALETEIMWLVKISDYNHFAVVTDTSIKTFFLDEEGDFDF